jgi:hypothetical protein
MSYCTGAIWLCSFFSYLWFGECYEDNNITVRFSNNISQLLTIVVVNVNIIAIYDLWKSTYPLCNSFVRLFTLFTLLFRSLYLQIVVLYYVFIFLVRLWANPNLKYNCKMSKQWYACTLLAYARDIEVYPATGALYWPSIVCGTSLRVRPDILSN